VKAVNVAGFEEVMRPTFPGRASAIEEVDFLFRIPGRLVTLPVDMRNDDQKIESFCWNKLILKEVVNEDNCADINPYTLTIAGPATCSNFS
jgi:hypothetical protein